MIRQTVWLHFRFTLSLRNIDEMLAERGIDASYETVRCWSVKFGRLFAQTFGDPDQNRLPAGTWTIWP